MYKTVKTTTEISVADYTRDYVDVDRFLEFCKACPNFDQIWSCPSYDFDPNDYWAQYTHLDIIGIKIIFDESVLSKTYTPEEINEIISESLWTERKKLDAEIKQLEEKTPNSVALSAGSCKHCGTTPCQRLSNKPCCQPDKMRYSIESIGGDVEKTVRVLLNSELKWAKDGKLPEYFTLVSGLLTN